MGGSVVRIFNEFKASSGWGHHLLKCKHSSHDQSYKTFLALFIKIFALTDTPFDYIYANFGHKISPACLTFSSVRGLYRKTNYGRNKFRSIVS